MKRMLILFTLLYKGGELLSAYSVCLPVRKLVMKNGDALHYAASSASADTLGGISDEFVA